MGFQGTDRYKVERRLGAGGFGEVFAAVDRQRDDRVAIKTLKRLEPDALYRFKKEFRSLADIASPNLITLYELHADGETWFFTMELVEGVDFLTHVRGGGDPGTTPTAPEVGAEGSVSSERAPSPDEARLRAALRQLGEGVSALHAAGWLHRDIKPSNVLVTPDGRVVLLDFGLVTEADGQRTTEANVVMGTATYMPPEQARGEPVNEAGDWYAVGVMLYEALAGRPPFSGPVMRVLMAKQTVDPPPPWEIEPSSPRDLGELAMRLLRREPAERAGAEAVLATTRITPAPSPVTPVARHAPIGEIFVGREQELAQLREAFAAGHITAPVVVHLSGRSGVGKTALLDHFIQGHVSSTKNAVVLRGRCYERESVPYKAMDSVIDGLCRYLQRMDRTAAAELMPRDARALARLFPVLDRLAAFADAPNREVADRVELRRRAFVALRELLARIADRGPLVVAVDDLQWGDVDSARVIGELTSGQDAPAVLLLLSYRSEEAVQSPFLAELARQTTMDIESIHIEVDDLPPEEAIQLARSLLAEADPDLSRKIADESCGNPIFIQALAQHQRAGTEPSRRGLTMEEAIRALVAARSDGARRLLEVVAVCGQRIEVDLAREAAGLVAGWRTDLASLIQLHLLRRCAGSGDLVECYHDKIRETVVAALTDGALQDHHRRLARALESDEPRDPERLATHYTGAGDPGRAGQYAAEAASLAFEKLAFERAAMLYETALALGRFDEPAKQTLRQKLADALANAGRGAESAPRYLEAASSVSGREALELKLRAAEQYMSTGLLTEGVRVATQVLDAVGEWVPRSERRAIMKLLARRAHLRLRGLRYEERPEREIPADLLTRIDIVHAVAKGLAMAETLRAAPFATRALLLALRAGEPVRIAGTAALEAAHQAMEGPAAADRSGRLLRLAEIIAKRLGDPTLDGAVSVARSARCWALGEFGEGRVAGERAARIFDEQCTGVAWENNTARIFTMASMHYTGDWRRAAELLPAYIRAARDRGDLYAVTWLHIRFSAIEALVRGDPTSARAQIDTAIDRWPSRSFDGTRWWWLYSHVHIALYAGEPEQAWSLMQRHWADLQRSHYLRIAGVDVGACYLQAGAALAVLATTRSARSSRELPGIVERAIRRIERYGMRWSAAVAKRLRATRLHVEGDAPAARALLAQAVAELEAAGMRLHAAAARRQLGQLLGGEEGRGMIELADETMGREGIKQPPRIADMLAPGFARS